jgi:hypothetical protein
MPQTCPQCQSEASDVANNCPNCGAQLAAAGAPQGAAAGATPPPPPPPPPSAAPAGAGAAATTSAVPPYKFDAARWSLADRISGVATIVLFISLFLSWFGISVIGVTVTASGVSAHGWLYIVMIIAILIVAYLVLRAGWDELPGGINLPHLITMMVATLINLVLVFIAFIDKPGGSGVGWEFGAFVALIAAAAAAAPYAIPQLRAKTMG